MIQLLFTVGLVIIIHSNYGLALLFVVIIYSYIVILFLLCYYILLYSGQTKVPCEAPELATLQGPLVEPSDLGLMFSIHC